MDPSGKRWYDAEAGPVVRPYAIVGGRTRPTGGSFDVVAMVSASQRAQPDPASLEPEHMTVLGRCRRPVSVADLASETSLPIGILRILLADLREQGLVVIRRPVQPDQMPDQKLLRRVADGLRRL